MRFVFLCIFLLMTVLCAEAQTDIDQKVDTINAINFSLFNNPTIYSEIDGLSNSSISDIVEDKNGFIWVSTNNGVSRFDGSHFLNFQRSVFNYIDRLYIRFNKTCLL